MTNVVLIRSNPVKPYPRLEKMANCISKLGFGVTVLAWDRAENYAPKTEELVLKDHVVKIIRVGIKGQFSGGFKKNAIGLMRFQWFIFSWLKKHRSEYSIIHAYDFDTGWIASKCAQLFHKHLIYDIADYYVASHGLTGSFIGKIVKRSENNVINQSEATIICTEERKAQIVGTNPKRLIVIHNTPDLCIKDYSSLPHNKRLKIVYVGIFGGNRFLKEVCECIAERKDVELHIAGFGNNMEAYYDGLSKEHDNIFYYGRIPYAETIALERKCDIMLAIYDPSVPNHFYAAPNKFYEALALGKPLIMVKGTGMSSIINQQGIGELMDYSKDGFNQAIDKLIARRHEFEDISAKARSLYESSYSWAEMERRITELYRQFEV